MSISIYKMSFILDIINEFYMLTSNTIQYLIAVKVAVIMIE